MVLLKTVDLPLFLFVSHQHAPPARTLALIVIKLHQCPLIKKEKESCVKELGDLDYFVSLCRLGVDVTSLLLYRRVLQHDGGA